MITAYIDGGARGNPGPAGYGVHVVDDQGNTLADIYEGIGYATNNVAEYRALRRDLETDSRQNGHVLNQLASSYQYGEPIPDPAALRAVYDVAGAVNIPIVGSGGVAGGTDVAEFMLAGATAIQVGTTSFVRDPHDILAEFAAYLSERGQGAAQLTGALRGVRATVAGGTEV